MLEDKSSSGGDWVLSWRISVAEYKTSAMHPGRVGGKSGKISNKGMHRDEMIRGARSGETDLACDNRARWQGKGLGKVRNPPPKRSHLYLTIFRAESTLLTGGAGRRCNTGHVPFKRRREKRRGCEDLLSTTTNY